MTEFKTEMTVWDKIQAVIPGTTHIKNVDINGVEHIGLIKSIDPTDDRWVNVTNITPPMRGRFGTNDHWDLATNTIEA